MQKFYIRSLLLFLLSIQFVAAQQPQKPNAADIYNQIQKLNFLGSVLYIAAHPDDENTKLISYLSNETKARTGYLSMTRGDGGQNLIGPQLRELLGVIRTQELLEARKIDGGEQFFTRANDFGYSKSPEETLKIWDKDQVLSDIVWTIRKFQPDVIINRFDNRTSRNTHGHHTASAILSVESFDLANNPKAYPEQLKFVEPWQTKRAFFNPSYWFYGSKEKFDAADKSKFLKIETGVYFPLIGKSNQEIAALSRSCHQSQGFGSTAVRNKEIEYLEQIKGDIQKDKTSIFEGIDTTWNRVKGGEKIGKLLSKIASEYDFKNPSASISDLTKAYTMIQSLDENHWKSIKSEEIKNIIASCAGLYLEAVVYAPNLSPASRLLVKLEAINRSSVPMQLESIMYSPVQEIIPQNLDLKNNELNSISLDLQLPSTIDYSQPYWLKEKATEGMYRVSNQEDIGKPEKSREIKMVFNVLVNGIRISFERAAVHKYNDKVRGEMYSNLDIVPEVSTSFVENVLLFRENKTKSVGVKIKAAKDDLIGSLRIDLPDHWVVVPKSIPFKMDKAGTEQTYYFEVTPPNLAEEVLAKSIVTIGDKQYNQEQICIDYSHISKQQVLKTAEAKCIRMDLKTKGEKIGYIMGAGDEVPNSLAQMGYKVEILKAAEITPEKLEKFDVVMTGIRAFNTVEALANKENILFDFVKSGKTMIAQYNTPDLAYPIAPYPMTISSDRVTEEDAEVRFLAPNHPVLNTPNTITKKDFEGWKQEQGLYYPNSFDKAFIPILSSNDAEESPKNGALLVAPYGKGYYIYTGLSFFRELPEGVSGAYRLLSNMISLKNSITIPGKSGKLEN